MLHYIKKRIPKAKFFEIENLPLIECENRGFGRFLNKVTLARKNLDVFTYKKVKFVVRYSASTK